MENKLIILGAGAAPGVPSLGTGYGRCNPENPKNTRTRAATYLEYKGVKFLIDTGPDMRAQLIAQNIRNVDAVLYSHSHADHLHGIDDLREINRINHQSLDIYAGKYTIKKIEHRFDYLIASKKSANNVIRRPSLVMNAVKAVSDGTTIGVYRDGENKVPVKLRTEKPDTWDSEFIEDLPIWNGKNSAPLAQVADGIKTGWEFPLVRTYNRKLSMAAQCDVIRGCTMK